MSPKVSLESLPQFYGWREVLALFPDEEAFLDAYCDGTLPLVTRQVVRDTCPERTLECLLLRRLVQLQLAARDKEQRTALPFVKSTS